MRLLGVIAILAVTAGALGWVAVHAKDAWQTNTWHAIDVDPPALLPICDGTQGIFDHCITEGPNPFETVIWERHDDIFDERSSPSINMGDVSSQPSVADTPDDTLGDKWWTEFAEPSGHDPLDGYQDGPGILEKYDNNLPICHWPCLYSEDKVWSLPDLPGVSIIDRTKE